jgi:hypothetical protein
MVNRAEGVEIFKQRWEEAKASGCTAVLFEEDKWPLIDMLVEEAVRSQSMRRDLIAAVVELRKLDVDIKVSENTDDHGGPTSPNADIERTARAA